jgi:hypothetical protein
MNAETILCKWFTLHCTEVHNDDKEILLGTELDHTHWRNSPCVQIFKRRAHNSTLILLHLKVHAGMHRSWNMPRYTCPQYSRIPGGTMRNMNLAVFTFSRGVSPSWKTKLWLPSTLCNRYGYCREYHYTHFTDKPKCLRFDIFPGVQRIFTAHN